ncbi:MAG: 4-hydroxy-tetrahydrodipicolinate reductase [Isosphaeraceae bacterium]|nr:4-hydroxy-tetrahydrodipicolinate reductase [Isosphaeraceae bacterium]
MTTTIAIHGAVGRMGARLIALGRADAELEVVEAIDRADHPGIGSDVGPLIGLGPIGLPLSDRHRTRAGALIDFSTPVATLGIARACVELGTPLVVGTTGLEPEQKHELAELARSIPILISPNMSRAVNLLFRLVGEAAKALGATADIEIVERHHRFKKDAPSGTALRLAEVAAASVPGAKQIHGRSGITGERTPGEIGVHALRTGDNPGEHTVVFGLMGECLELSHRALNRDGFALGALAAAKFLAGKPAGLYGMADVLG